MGPTIEMGDFCRRTVPGPHLTVPEELVWPASAAQDISHLGAGAYAMGVGGNSGAEGGEHGDEVNWNPMFCWAGQF